MEIIIVTQRGFENRIKKILKKFTNRYPELNDLNFLLAELDIHYENYQADTASIHDWQALAWLVDPRLENQEEPVRMMINPTLIKCEQEEIDGVLLHELGIFYTAETVRPVKELIGKNNPRKISLSDHSYADIIKRHNRGLYYLLQIFKLPQDILGEEWLYRKNPELGQKRIRHFFANETQNLEALKAISSKEDLFYNLTCFIYITHFKRGVIRRLDEPKLDERYGGYFLQAKDFLDYMVLNRGLSHLKLIKRFDDLGVFIQGDNFGYKDLIDIYDELFEEYINESAPFFPSDVQSEIKQFYFKPLKELEVS